MRFATGGCGALAALVAGVKTEAALANMTQEKNAIIATTMGRTPSVFSNLSAAIANAKTTTEISAIDLLLLLFMITRLS